MPDEVDKIRVVVEGDTKSAERAFFTVRDALGRFAKVQAETKEEAEELAKQINKTEEKVDDFGKTVKKTGEETESLSKVFRDDLRNSLLTAQAAYEGLKAAAGFVIETIKESVVASMDSERATARLTFAVKSAGFATDYLVPKLEGQADALARATGETATNVKELQRFLLQMKVAPKDLERFTKLVLDYSAVMGQDALEAADSFTESFIEGRKSIEAWNVSVTDSEFAAKGFLAVVEKAESQFKGTSTAVTEQAKSLNAAKAAWEQFEVGLGGAIVGLGDITGLTKLATMSLDGLSELLSGKMANANAKTLVTYTKLGRLREEEIQAVKDLEEAERGLAVARDEGAEGAVGSWEQIIRGMKAQLADIRAQRFALQGMKDPLLYDTAAGPTFDAEAAAKDAQNARKERAKAQADLMADLTRGSDEARKHQEALVAKQREGVGDVLEAANKREEEEMKELFAAVEKDTEAHNEKLKKFGEARADFNDWLRDREREEEDRRLEEIRAHNEAVQDEMRGFAEGFLNSQVSMFAETLLENRAYTDEVRALSIDRRAEEMAEASLRQRYTAAELEQLDDRQKAALLTAEAETFRGKATKEAADEERAAFMQKQSEILAGIAQEAAVKAIFQTAEGFAKLGNPYTAALAGPHFVAAAQFGAVAAVAGVGAFALSQGRGKTSAERQNTESLQRQDDERAARSSGASARESARAIPAQVNVYNIGISGVTELEQMREVERMRRQYDRLKTGG